MFNKFNFGSIRNFLNQPLRIMIVPHSKKSSINFCIRYKTFLFVLFLFFAFFTYSFFKTLSYSTYVNKLTKYKSYNVDFSQYINFLEKEIFSLEKEIDFYKNKVTALHKSLVLENSTILPKTAIGGMENLTQISENSDTASLLYQLKKYVYDFQKINEKLTDINQSLKQKETVVNKLPSIWPIRGDILYPFGKFFDPISGNFLTNNKVGIKSFANEPVKATADGKIVGIHFVSNYGYSVKIQHKYACKTIYSNLKQVYVKVGAKIKKNEILGLVGKPKNNPYYYLDYGIVFGKTTMNPFDFLGKVSN